VTAPVIPNRAVFRAQEVCDLAQVQPYVLRSWEAEFPDLGVAKTPASPRVYRRSDVELVLRLKHLLFVDGLTLAGARRQLGDTALALADGSVSDADVAALIDDETRQHLRDVRRGLQWILGVLDGSGVTPDDRVLVASPPVTRGASKNGALAATTGGVKRKAAVAKPAKKGARGRR
jgi:DNA-binding transcriptional MerR regulator